MIPGRAGADRPASPAAMWRAQPCARGPVMEATTVMDENLDPAAPPDYNRVVPGTPTARSGDAMNQDATPTKRRVLIVDDHAVVRAGFRKILDATDDFRAEGEAGTAAEALASIAQHAFDVVMLDISLPDATVLETVSALKRRRPDLPILIVSMHSEDQYAVNLMRAGVSGFFPKAGEAKDLLAALRLVVAGRKYVSPALAEALALEATGVTQEPPHRQLSSREFQVFVGLAAGKTVTDLAAAMCLSVKTVSTYRARVLEKMNLERNADLTAYALRHNLLA
jgi:two-component system invasion response regulator UvrY